MSILVIQAGSYRFEAKLELAAAPKTCEAFQALLPLRSQVVHVRWSGEGIWIPFGDNHFDLPWENNTSHPAPGQMLLYPGGISEAEIIWAYGAMDFSSKMGQLAGNHFLSLTSGQENLVELGNKVLWQGAQDISIEAAS